MRSRRWLERPRRRATERRPAPGHGATAPTVSYRLRTVAIGVDATFLAIAALLAYALLSKAGQVDGAVFWPSAAVALASAIAIRWCIPWSRWVLGRKGELAFYAWSIGDIVLVCVAIVATGGSRSEMFLLFPMPITFFAISYPRRGQIALLAFSEVAYVTTLALSGWDVGAAVLVFRLTILAVIAYMASFVAGELSRAMLDHAAARAESERRAELLTIAAEEQRAVEDRLVAIMQNSDDIIMVLDRDGTIRHSNPAVARILGSNEGLEVGDNIFSRVHPEDMPEVLAAFKRVLEHRGFAQTIELRVRHADGGWRIIEAIGRNLLDQPAVEGIVVNARDVTERTRMREELARQAVHDHLTGLPNRVLLLDRLGLALERVARQSSSLAVLFVDLDHFKLVNDTLGHSAGDELLVAITGRLRAAMRPADTIARFGGDEFVVLCEDVGSVDGALAVASRLESALAAPFTLAGRELFVTMSVGIALGHDPGIDAEALLSEADSAMYRAKERGRHRIEVFDERLRSDAIRRLETESALRRGLERGEFELWYQPQVDLVQGRVVGAEALVRWRHPVAGLVLPDRFVPTAEETGLIVPIGTWVLREACSEATRWPSADDEPLLVSVNLSARQVNDPDLLAVVEAALLDSGLEPARLVLEITESAVMQDAARSIEILHGLKALGVGLATDDFGTGYSSLSYLQQFPIDYLKIDRSFVKDLGIGANTRAIVASVITMARSLGMRTVAEGIEEQAHIDALRSLGCDFAQGYWYARPLPVDALRELLREATIPEHPRRVTA
jgi:diguanylate cyclase (GGDEF)-like protein/PAS domain S-box-containing protein